MDIECLSEPLHSISFNHHVKQQIRTKVASAPRSVVIPTCSLREPSENGTSRQEQTRTLLPSTNRSYTPVDSRQSRYIDKCDMHKLLFAVVHLLLDKASCYILDKSGETPSATYGRVEKG